MQQYLFLPLPVDGVLSDSLRITGTAPYMLQPAAALGSLQPIEVQGLEFWVRENLQVDALLALDAQHTRWQPGTRIEAAIFERDSIRQVSPIAVFEAGEGAPSSYCELRLGRTWLVAGAYTVLAICRARGSEGDEEQMVLSSDPEQEKTLRSATSYRSPSLSGMSFTRREAVAVPVERRKPVWPRG